MGYNKNIKGPSESPLSEFWTKFEEKLFKIQKRKIWAQNRKAPEAAEPMYPLKTPVSFVYLSFTLAPGGKSKIGQWWGKSLGPKPGSIKVIKALQDMQANEFKKRKPEIKYNFMIGGDGVVYEGRGWFKRPEIPKKYWYNAKDSFYIGFIGGWESSPPAKTLIELKDELVYTGIEKKIIKKKHCQIAFGLSGPYMHELPKHFS